MNSGNNLGRQYTQKPDFGDTYPNTQYKGYAEEEGSPYGIPSPAKTIKNVNILPHYTPLYEGNIPHHPEDRLDVTRYQGVKQKSPGESFPYQEKQPPQPITGTQYMNPNYGTDLQKNTQNNIAPGMQSQQAKMSQPQMQIGQEVTGPEFNDRDRIFDLLTSETYLTEGYNISSFEATDPDLYNTLKNILSETHNNRQRLYQLMEQKGWSHRESADSQEIAQTFNEFNQYKTQLPFI